LVRHWIDERPMGAAENSLEERTMARFMFLYRRDADMQMSPDEMQKMMQRWNDWIADGLKKGWMLDTGDGLLPDGRQVNAKKVISDGPFVESKEIVGGYSLIEAETIDDAAELAKGCPVFERGGMVEVRPLAGFTAKREGSKRP
jgi:hypothetical protein